MRTVIKIKVAPSILKYARYCGGYKNIAEAAKKLGMKEEGLASLESDGGEVSFARLDKFATVYKMPRAYFFLKQKPDDAIIPDGFRIVYASGDDIFSPKVMLAIRKARYVQSVIQELSEEKTNYNLKTISLTDNADDVAGYFRSMLGVSYKDQLKWYDPSTALRNWKAAVEKLGIFVLQQSIPDDDVSAFCLADQVPYIISLNSTEHENRRIFSLFHEIGHILLHQSGICTPDNLSRNSVEYTLIEKYCNQFAASLLVPYQNFIEDSLVKKLRGLPFENWDTEEVKVISQRFKVSQEVIYRRLMTIGILDEAKYKAKRNELIRGFDEYKKRKKGGNEKLIIPQYRKIISANGRAYSFFILDNLHSNRITFADAADYLDTNSRHIAKIEEHI